MSAGCIILRSVFLIVFIALMLADVACLRAPFSMRPRELSRCSRQHELLVRFASFC